MVRLDTMFSNRMRNYTTSDKDKEIFHRRYNMTPQEFMDDHSDNREVDITGKIVAIYECSSMTEDEERVPLPLANIYIPEECNAIAKIIYSGHYISFLIYTGANGVENILYKDDECPPITLSEYYSPCMGEISEPEYLANENGYGLDDIDCQIEMLVRSMYDYKYRLTNKEDVIVLQGL